jgi:hypothetical protein
MCIRYSYSCAFNRAPRHEGVLGSGRTAPRILDPGIRWWWVVSFTPWWPYPPGKGPLAPTGQPAGWAPEPVWAHWWRENSQPLLGLELPIIIQSVALRYTTELSRLLSLSLSTYTHCHVILIHILFYKHTLSAKLILKHIIHNLSFSPELRNNNKVR